MTSNYRDQLKGRQQALYDDIQAVLRVHRFDDSKAKDIIELLEGDNG